MTEPSTAPYETVLSFLTRGWTWQARIDPGRSDVTLTVERDASVTVTVPAGADPIEVGRSVEKNMMWLARRVRLAREVAPDHPRKELVGGEGFAWLGRSHRLRVVDDGPPVLLERGPSGWMRLHRDHAHDAAALIAWYSEQGAAWIAPRTRRMQERIGIRTPVDYRFADLGEEQSKVRLGAAPVVTLHWAVCQLDVPLVDYALMRELCHVGAGRRVGKAEHARLLTRCMPGWADDHRRLIQDWRTVWIGGVRNLPARRPVGQGALWEIGSSV